MLSSSDAPRLAPWVVLHEECGRRDRSYHMAVNTRDGVALRLEGEEVGLLRHLDGGHRLDELATTAVPLAHDLYAGGFLTDRPAELDRREKRTLTQRVAKFLSTLDVQWSDADRLVRALYRLGGRLAFRPAAVAAQLVLAVAGAAAMLAAFSNLHMIEIHASARDVPLLLAVNLVAIAVHELAHGLVVVHYGRSVRAVGFRLHLGTPAFYVDSVDALLLTRRQRMIQAAAGPWAEWLVTSTVALILWHSPWPLVTAVLLRFTVLNTLTIVSNLLPFAGLDGYLLLCDLVREPELSHRSRQALRSIVRQLRRGHVPDREVAALGAYAVLNGLAAGALLAASGFFWYQLFGDSLARLTALGPAGWMAVAALIGLLLRPTAQALSPLLVTAPAGARQACARARFRMERRWRVRATEQIHELAPFAHLDERALGVLAGRLELLPLGRHETASGEAFAGGLVVTQRRAPWRRADVVILPQRWVDEFAAAAA